MSREGRNNFRCFKHRLIFQTVSRQSLGSQGFNNACHKNMYKYAFFPLSLSPPRSLSVDVFIFHYVYERKEREIRDRTSGWGDSLYFLPADRRRLFLTSAIGHKSRVLTQRQFENRFYTKSKLPSEVVIPLYAAPLFGWSWNFACLLRTIQAATPRLRNFVWKLHVLVLPFSCFSFWFFSTKTLTRALFNEESVYIGCGERRGKQNTWRVMRINIFLKGALCLLWLQPWSATDQENCKRRENLKPRKLYFRKFFFLFFLFSSQWIKTTESVCFHRLAAMRVSVESEWLSFNFKLKYTEKK